MALGSLPEVEYCGLLSQDVGYINEEFFNSLSERINIVKAKLINLIKSIRK